MRIGPRDLAAVRRQVTPAAAAPGGWAVPADPPGALTGGGGGGLEKRAMVRCAVALLGALVLAAPAARADDLATAVRAALAAALAAGPAATVAGVSCAGDCNGDGRISVDELVRAVGIALGNDPPSACPGLDTSGNGRVEVGELVAAVGRALNGCGDDESVCGGPITSAPTLCDLTVTPRITTAFGTLRISFALSDLEGDLTQICGALALSRDPQPALACDPLPPRAETVNAVLELDPIQLMGARNGTYVLYLQVRDARGGRSAVVSATFTVGVRA